jgi:hypothetical protein
MAIPAFVRDGFVREDIAREGNARGFNFFHSGRQPAVGQMIKVQLHFVKSMRTDIPGERTTWCLMGGKIQRVVDDRCLEVTFRPSSDNAPDEAENDWNAVLVYDDSYMFPWIVRSMTIASSWQSPPRIYRHKRAIESRRRKRRIRA